MKLILDLAGFSENAGALFPPDKHSNAGATLAPNCRNEQSNSCFPTMKIFHFPMAVFFLVALCGCDAKKQIKDVNARIDAFNKNFADFTKKSAEAVDRLALAVPGEWFNTLLRDIHGSDKEKATKAKELLHSLMGERGEAYFATDYEGAVWVSAEERLTTVHLDVFQAPDTSIKNIEDWFKGNRDQLAATSVVLKTTATTAVLKTQLVDILSDYTNAVMGQPSGRAGYQPLMPSPSLNTQPIINEWMIPYRTKYSPVEPPLNVRDAQQWKSMYLAGRGTFYEKAAAQLDSHIKNVRSELVEQTASRLASAFSDAYPAHDIRRSRDWKAFQGRDVLFILSRHEDVEAIKTAKGRMYAAVNRKAQATEAKVLPGSETWEVPLDGFRPIPASISNHENLVWIAHHMTGSFNMSVDYMKATAELKTLRDQILFEFESSRSSTISN